VHDGDHLVIGNYTVGTCYNQVAEIVRQRKKELTIYSQSGVFDVEMLIAGDCVSRVVSTYCLRSEADPGAACWSGTSGRERSRSKTTPTSPTTPG